MPSTFEGDLDDSAGLMTSIFVADGRPGQVEREIADRA
jgi:hypothetical protein